MTIMVTKFYTEIKYAFRGKDKEDLLDDIRFTLERFKTTIFVRVGIGKDPDVLVFLNSSKDFKTFKVLGVVITKEGFNTDNILKWQKCLKNMKKMRYAYSIQINPVLN